MNQINLSPGGIATLACILEVTSPKPGNVHRGADFEDVSFTDFATSAVVLGEVIQTCAEKTLGETILASVHRNEQAVGTNTNLGIVLLLVPLAKIAASKSAADLESRSVTEYLSKLTPSDGADVFEAIKLAQPGGLGEADQMDVNSNGCRPVDLLSAMRTAADRDSIAKQYVTGFRDVFELGVPLLSEGRKTFGNLSLAIIYAHVALMARRADSLIARKCGTKTAEHSRFLAAKAIESLKPLEDLIGDDRLEEFWSGVGELDFWLRSDGHRRNPGTTADLIAASLFVGIHNGIITAPFR